MYGEMLAIGYRGGGGCGCGGGGGIGGSGSGSSGDGGGSGNGSFLRSITSYRALWTCSPYCCAIRVRRCAYVCVCVRMCAYVCVCVQHTIAASIQYTAYDLHCSVLILCIICSHFYTYCNTL